MKRYRIRVYNDAQAGLAERERVRINAVAEAGNRRIAADEQALHDRITALLRPAREAAQGTPWQSENESNTTDTATTATDDSD